MRPWSLATQRATSSCWRREVRARTAPGLRRGAARRRLEDKSSEVRRGGARRRVRPVQYCYAREGADVVAALRAGLVARRSPFGRPRGHPFSAPWRQRTLTVFVLGAHWVVTPEAVTNACPPSSPSWPESRADIGVDAVVAALAADLEWREAQIRLLVHAAEWDRRAARERPCCVARAARGRAMARHAAAARGAPDRTAERIRARQAVVPPPVVLGGHRRRGHPRRARVRQRGWLSIAAATLAGSETRPFAMPASRARASWPRQPNVRRDKDVAHALEGFRLADTADASNALVRAVRRVAERAWGGRRLRPDGSGGGFRGPARTASCVYGPDLLGGGGACGARARIRAGSPC